MKKALIFGLTAALLLASLTACNNQADQPAEPDPTPTPSAVQTQPLETPEPEKTTPPVEPTAKVDEVQPMAALVEITQEEMPEYFEVAYDAGQLYADLGYDGDSLIEQELKELSFFVGDGTAKWPDDVNDQYLAWREANHPKVPVTGAPSSNPQTQPSTNNQAQPVSNQTGPGGATIVHDPSTDYSSPSGSLATGGERADFSQVKTSEEMGFAPIDPSNIIYGGGN